MSKLNIRFPWAPLLSVSVLITNGLIGVGAVLVGPADTFNKVAFPIVVVAATAYAFCAMIARHRPESPNV